MPTFSMNVCVFLRVDQRLHADAIEGVWFYEIGNVEGVLEVFSSVRDSEKVPLREIRVRTEIYFEMEIVSVGSDLGSSFQVTTFKSTFKN
jgi:hypothetical protein